MNKYSLNLKRAIKFFVLLMVLFVSILSVSAQSWDNANWVSYWMVEDLTTDFKNNNNLTNTGVTPTTLVYNVSGQFNSLEGDFLKSADSEDWEFTEFTCAGWFDAEGTNTLHRTIIGTFLSGSGSSNGFYLNIQRSGASNPNKLELYASDGSFSDTIYSLNTVTSGLHHVAFGFNSTSGDLFLYINGTSSFTETTEGISTLLYPAGTDMEMYIGKRQDGRNFDGILDEWGCWNTALSKSTVNEIFQQGVSKLSLISNLTFNPLPSVSLVSPANSSSALNPINHVFTPSCYDNCSSATLWVKEPLFFDSGNPTRTVVHSEIGGMDGIQVYDIDGDGDLDIGINEEQDKEVYWLEQITPSSWTKHHVASISDEGMEGLEIADIDGDGDVEIYSAREYSTTGNIDIAVMDTAGTPNGTWTTTQLHCLNGVYSTSDLIAGDIDEDNILEIIHVWDGANISLGGFGFFDFEGTNLSDCNDWVHYTIVEGANVGHGSWWFSEKFTNISQDATGKDFVVSARDEISGTVVDLYWVEQPTGDVHNTSWIVHNISTNITNAVHVDIGDVSGESGLDIIVVDKNTDSLYWFNFSESYSTRRVFDNFIGVTNPFGIIIKDVNELGERDEVFTTVRAVNSKRYMYEYYNNSWQRTEFYSGGDNKCDDRIILADINNDGIDEFITACSIGNFVDYIDFSNGGNFVNVSTDFIINNGSSNTINFDYSSLFTLPFDTQWKIQIVQGDSQSSTSLTYDLTILGTAILSPIIIYYSPANNTMSNILPEPSFKVIDVDNGSLSCSLYIDDVLNQTNSAVMNDTITNFTLTSFLQGVHTIQIKCDDGTTISSTGKYNYYYDSDEPFIQSSSPSPFNTSIFYGYSMDIIGNVTNLDIINLTITINYPNSTLFYKNETTSFVNSSFYLWDLDFDTSLEPNGVWSMEIFSEDSGLNSNTILISFTVNNCIPSWMCSDYGACNITDTAECIFSTDSNSCGLNYTGNYSEFGDQACNYCSYSLEELTRGACGSDNLQLVLYNDTNFYTCCDITGLGSDCFFGGFSFGTVNESCSLYYTSEDIGYATIDLLMAFILTIGIFLPTATLIWLLVRVRTNLLKKRK